MPSQAAISFSLGLAAYLVAPASAFFKLPCAKPLVTERADPVVNPGTVSGHLHTIMGGNGFGFTMDYAQTQQSTCSTCKVNGDFSNYWVPTVYFKAENGSFISVEQNGGALIYYQDRKDDPDQKLLAFPEGFRMLAGDPSARSFDGSTAAEAVSYACLGTSTKETNGLPDINCPNGLRAQIYFPSCWNGKDLDSDDHKSHIVYPSKYNGGDCPEGFKDRTVSIFYEVLWHTERFADQWHGDGQPFVLSNGDPTGFGYHGDFVNGWDVELLQEAVDTCNSGSDGNPGQGGIGDCAVLAAKFYDDDIQNGCIIPPSVNEKVFGELDALPGCNPIQAGPAKATTRSGCGAPTTFGKADSFFTDLTSTKKWQYVGCGKDIAFESRTLSGADTSGDDMTVEKCVDFCIESGFSVAGLEYGRESVIHPIRNVKDALANLGIRCYCDNDIPEDRAPTKGVTGNCMKKCAGDDGEYCGGAQLMSLYKKCDGACENSGTGVVGNSTVSEPASDDDAPPTDAGNPQAASGDAPPPKDTGNSEDSDSPDSSPPPSDTSGVKGKAPVDAGTSPAPSAPTPSESPYSYPAPAPPKSSDDSSNSPDSSDSTSDAGSELTLTEGWKAEGCYIDPLNPRALDFNGWWGEAITSTGCVKFCDSQGYEIAGTENAGQCFCGHKLNGGKAAANSSECSLKCRGDDKQTCGGPKRLSLFKKSSSSKAKMRRSVHRHGKRHSHDVLQ
ncbi:MAG: hypothetical protein M1837_005427 [Sclerophora amabilis]|nr:MAG: hypothetical protein M1837_005427 [Sclerophora amabilis]